MLIAGLPVRLVWDIQALWDTSCQQETSGQERREAQGPESKVKLHPAGGREAYFFGKPTDCANTTGEMGVAPAGHRVASGPTGLERVP